MPICEVRALHLAVDRLADVVQERRAHGDVRVEADLPRHDAGQPRDLRRVGQHVLAVAGAVLQPAHQPQDLRMQIVQAELERDRRAFLAHRLVGLVLHLLDDLLDARRVDAAVGDQPLDGLLGDLAAVRIEAGQDDRARRVVDDQVDAGGELERADVAPLAADDAPLQIVARQIDDRDGRLDRVLGGAALDRLGDVVLGAIDGGLARFGVEALQQVGRVVARVAFDLLDQQLLGLVGRQAGHALELVLLLRDELLVLRGGGGRGCLALGRRRGRARGSSFSSRSTRLWRSASADSRRPSVCSSVAACWRSWRAWRSASIRISCAFSLASSSASFLRVSASRSASLTSRGAPAPRRGRSVSAAMRLRLATQTANTRAAVDQRDDEVEQQIRISATRVTSFP